MIVETYVGDIEGKDIQKAISALKKINPNAKRVYARLDGKTLQFIGRNRVDDGSIKEIILHQAEIDDSDIGMADVNVVNGFPICVSIPLYEHLTSELSPDNRSILGYKRAATFGCGVSCPL